MKSKSIIYYLKINEEDKKININVILCAYELTYNDSSENHHEMRKYNIVLCS